MNDIKNGKFWKALAIIFTVILIPLIFGSYAYTSMYGGKIVEVVVLNDRLRQKEDKDIARDVQTKVDVINKDVAHRLDKIQQDISDIKVAIAGMR